MSTNAERHAAEIWQDRSEDIADAADVKWYVAEYVADHDLSERVADQVTAILIAGLR